MGDKVGGESLESRLMSLRKSPRALLLFDYDGTLVPIVSHPAWARPDEDLLSFLGQLAARPSYTVGIISGRRVRELAEFFAGLNLYLVGLHGGEAITPEGQYVSYLDDQRVVNLALRGLASKTRELLRMLRQPPGFFLEDKGIALALHYRGASPAEVARVVPQFLAWAQDTLEKWDLEILRGKKMVEVRPRGMNKGQAVARLVAAWPGRLHPGTMILYAGDDITDEDAFQALSQHREAVTIYIGEAQRPTAACYRLPSPSSLRELIRRCLL